ncbi:MAG TPA: NAD-dependent epimerase/dehydratase family protein [Thermoplasmata archaeon]|nr:NAD-dependent epimerase/dehydratase family protein [Thermoplasmata archaeon]
MRAFVTGGTGLVGSHLVEGLIAHGWQVAVLTRSAERARALFDDRAWVVEGDLTRPNFHAELARTDVVFHAAGWIELGVRDGRRMLDVNVTGTANLLSIARKEGVPRIVYTDTAGVFAPAPVDRPATEESRAAPVIDDPYVVTKVQAHSLVAGEMRAGLPVTAILPGAVYGPRDTNDLGRTLARLVRGRLGTLPKGFGVNTWTHAADVAEAEILAATVGKPGAMYVLGDRVLSFYEFLERAARLAGVPPPRRRVPMWTARFVARLSEAKGRLLGRSPRLPLAALDLAAIDLAVDASKARKELGWSPKPFEERLRETIAWYVGRYRDGRAPLPVKPGGASGAGPLRRV